MDQPVSFIETQFPVSKVSKETYKERKANNGQTLTGLGKWWGRKPLILVRAAILGCLMPASDNPKKDTEIFLKLLSMDESGLEQRKKKFSVDKLFKIISDNKDLHQYLSWFDISGAKPKLLKDAPRDGIELAAFRTLGYDDKISMCVRPEEIQVNNPHTWNEINHHLGTSANSLQELVNQLSVKRFGHRVVVGDCFSGGGSIPFEAARIGCKAYGSDLNPIAGLLSWASIHLCGTTEHENKTINEFREKIYDIVATKIRSLGIEENDNGDIAISYLYCTEVTCPECGARIPLAPSWVIGRGSKTVAQLEETDGHYTFKIKTNATAKELELASHGTINDTSMVCPHCNKTTPITSVRHDVLGNDGITISGLRKWEKNEFVPRPDDVFHDRLYAIKYEHKDEKGHKTRYYSAPSKKDEENELAVFNYVKSHFSQWQDEGYIPSGEIEEGYNTSQPIRERGWKYWHQLFNPRQLLLNALFSEAISQCLQDDSCPECISAGLLGLNKIVIFNSKLSMWASSPGVEKTVWVFTNQALNTLFNYGCSALSSLKTCWLFPINRYPLSPDAIINLTDARSVTEHADIWVTDPPYADAVNYHELTELFLAWDKSLLLRAFPKWYSDSKRILAVRGDEHFSQTMIEIYKNLTVHMSDAGQQIVMFTHSDPAVWAQLAVIMWKAGLKVTAAWNIATETDSGGLKNGNYVKGTVLLVLRKQTGDDCAFLDEINADIHSEVKNQIASMQTLDDKEEPNFSDPDYVLAAYAASLKVLTSYASIEDLDLDYELNQAISNPSGSKIVSIIENAKKIAYDCVIPIEFSSFLWRDLSNAEKLYIKGLESEKHGNYQISTYQEFARGFSIGGYSQLMANEKANTARLKTPFEMAGRTLNDVPDFENSIMRVVFQGIYVGIKEDMNPQKALGFIKNELSNYWDKREMISQILTFLLDIKNISNMQPHWTDSAEMAELLFAAVTHDGV